MSPLAPRENPSLFGHDRALGVFRRALESGRLPHAWLIGGAPGIGKATMAYHLGRLVLATGAAVGEPDDPSSPLFRRVAHGSEADLLVLEPTVHPRSGKQRHEITVDQVRAVTTALHETAVGQGGRAVVVDAADSLNKEAANAFLKLLEEPPAGVVLFLVCHAPGRIPRTLLSRCIRLLLAPLDDQALRTALRAAGLTNDPQSALLTLAKGSPGRYVRLAATGFLEQYEALLASLAAATRDRVRLMEAAERLTAFGSSVGTDLAVDLISAVIQRGAEHASRGDLAESFVAGEGDRLSQLVRRLPLDQWLAMWDKLRRLAFDVDQLNVDSRQAYFLVLGGLIAAGPGPSAALRA